MELPPQKGFYDSRRAFQGQDDPNQVAANEPREQPPKGMPRSQVVAGLIILAVIALAFFSFALPEKPPGPAKAPAAPAAAQPKAK
jgi:hypothetical protein